MANKQNKERCDLNEAILKFLPRARRVVIKLGSRVLVKENGRPEMLRMRSLVHDVAALQQRGVEVILVTSGAIGTGMQALGLTKKPTNLPDLQMAAAIGQNKLMARYDELFKKEGCIIAQLLLTHDLLKHRERHLNTRNTLMALLRNRVIPIINENDTVSVDEIKFGDNDVLAALVTMLVESEVLVLLSSTNGLKNLSGKRATRIPYVEKIGSEVLSLACGKGSELSSGGMESKLLAAKMVVDAGALAIIADGRDANIIKKVFDGNDLGTRFGQLPKHGPKISSKKRWIAFYNRPEGSIVVNACATKALVSKGVSLLPVGIESVQGEFAPGSVVNIKSLDDAIIARGLTAYSSDQIKKIKGKHSSQIKCILGENCFFEEVIHRDNMVVFSEG